MNSGEWSDAKDGKGREYKGNGDKSEQRRGTR